MKTREEIIEIIWERSESHYRKTQSTQESIMIQSVYAALHLELRRLLETICTPEELSAKCADRITAGSARNLEGV